jgi:hypothetical protein
LPVTTFIVSCPQVLPGQISCLVIGICLSTCLLLLLQTKSNVLGLGQGKRLPCFNFWKTPENFKTVANHSIVYRKQILSIFNFEYFEFCEMCLLELVS